MEPSRPQYWVVFLRGAWRPGTPEALNTVINLAEETSMKMNQDSPGSKLSASAVPCVYGNAPEQERSCSSLRSRSGTPIADSRGLLISTETGRTLPSPEAAFSAIQNAVGASDVTPPSVFDLATVAHLEHELRAPIATAIGFLEIIRELIYHGQSGHELNEFLDITSANCYKMLARIDQIISYVDLQNNSQEIMLESANLHCILDRSQSMFKIEAIQKGLEFNFVPSHADRMVFSNSDRLLQILNIVVQNAIKFTNDGFVMVTTSEFHCEVSQDVFVEIAVLDTGIGFDAHDYDTIFLPFKQLDGGTARQFSGLGLGLAIARRIADLIGVVIHVESAKMKGSRFAIRVPAA